ncbi:hypothetical protein [Tenggerimyces flavus]|uniref:DUF4352 domain-containing protein n=1 Tax=Tenggerimyces flavus TaxID=1708749 RepID=A0ABV7YHC9_9ACTN|nr:hypothetical protein [Tenggerimyces flavus]MBM7784569.1 hypothetical protein [Tenggerimyces flavus]
MIQWLRRNVWRFAALLLLLPAYVVIETWDDLPLRAAAIGTVKQVPAKDTIHANGVTWRLNRIEDPRAAVDANGKKKPPRKDGIHYAAVYVSFKLDAGVTMNTPKCEVRLRDPATNRYWDPNGPSFGGSGDDLGLTAPPECLSASGKEKPQAGKWYTIVPTFLLPADAKNLLAEVSLGKKSDKPGKAEVWARFVP